MPVSRAPALAGRCSSPAVGAQLARGCRVSVLRASSVLAVTLAGACAAATPTEIDPFVDNAKADGHGVKLHLLDDHRLHVDEPSDLAFAGDQLYTVSDAHSKIYAIDRDGDVEDVIDVEGHDLEALAFDEVRGELMIADESHARVWHIAGDGTRYDPIDVPDADDGNSGIEGLAFDRDGHLVVAKEKDPARLIVLDELGGELDHEKIDFADDLSALAFRPDDGHLYALSDADHSLYRLERDFDVDRAWKLPIEHPEGLAFDGDLVYIASDSEERLYVLALVDGN